MMIHTAPLLPLILTMLPAPLLVRAPTPLDRPPSTADSASSVCWQHLHQVPWPASASYSEVVVAPKAERDEAAAARANNNSRGDHQQLDRSTQGEGGSTAGGTTTNNACASYMSMIPNQVGSCR